MSRFSDKTHKDLKAVADSIRILTVDAVETSTTGHPGMPMGMADLGAVLYGLILKHNPKNPSWLNRDRFVLSAGHGSMLLYSLLHLSGYGLSIDELKRFRRIHSLTPGHPEHGLTAGVETTTGPLGAGFSTAVGMAMGERIFSARFNTAQHRIFDHYTYVLAGDGCLMEGVTAEASSLAGHHKLGKLIVFYDSNKVSIEGPTDITFTEDVAKRFDAYGWQVLRGSAHEVQGIFDLTIQAQQETEKPSLIILDSVIGAGSPGMAGKHKVHGSPLGEQEAARTRLSLGCPAGDRLFYVHPRAYAYFQGRGEKLAELNEKWDRLFAEWAECNPEKKEELDVFLARGKPLYEKVEYPVFRQGDELSGREVSGIVLNKIAERIPTIIGGSADLSTSNKTEMPAFGDFTAANPLGRTIRFGVREHAMGSIGNGLALEGGFRPFCATLVLFADYLRPAMRLASLMGLPVIYILTHDSIFMGADGPTHQPVEHLASLRVIPGFRVLRPGDPEETVVAWQMALERLDGPTALILSRQALKVQPKADPEWRSTVRRAGAFLLQAATGKPEVVLLATGSEVGMALQALQQSGKNGSVVSVLCREMLSEAREPLRSRLLPPGVPVVAAEAGCHDGWEEFTGGKRENVFGIDRFGASGRPEEVAEFLGFTVDKLAALLVKAAE